MIKYYFLLVVVSLLAAHLASAQPVNTLIDNQNSPNEVSIAINPKHTNELVAGANLNFVYHSTDGGLSWNKHVMTSQSGVWGDPTIICDTNGHFYYFHLSNPNGGWGTPNFLDRIVCQKSTDGGLTWPGDYYLGSNTNNKIEDKQWTCVDPTTNTIYASWTQFDHYENIPFGFHVSNADSSIILFAKSVDGGVNWSNPTRISETAGDCFDSDNTTEGAVPCVGPNGEIYISWSNGNTIFFDRSTDYGNTWLTNDIIAATHYGGWEIVVPGMNRTNGMPVTACDLSNSPHHGTIYINWSDTRNGSNNTDIFLARSLDGGNTWLPTVKVNNDTDSTHQFLNWMSIDQVTGYIYIVYYDRSNHKGNDSTDVFLAVSKDGGQHFTNSKISATPFLADPNVFIGDYINVSAYNGMVHPIWNRTDNGVTSIWTTTIQEDLSALDYLKNNSVNYFLQCAPNPIENNAVLLFQLATDLHVNVTIIDALGRELIYLRKNQLMAKGFNQLAFNVGELGLENGHYLIGVKTREGRSYLPIAVLKN